jgi:hypothetical protein
LIKKKPKLVHVDYNFILVEWFIGKIIPLIAIPAGRESIFHCHRTTWSGPPSKPDKKREEIRLKYNYIFRFKPKQNKKIYRNNIYQDYACFDFPFQLGLPWLLRWCGLLLDHSLVFSWNLSYRSCCQLRMTCWGRKVKLRIDANMFLRRVLLAMDTSTDYLGLLLKTCLPSMATTDDNPKQHSQEHHESAEDFPTSQKIL